MAEIKVKAVASSLPQVGAQHNFISLLQGVLLKG